jgi:Uma2 family endonuclease
MTAPAPARPITADEFLHMPESRGAELVDGVIQETHMSGLSTWVAAQLVTELTLFLRRKPLGWAFTEGGGFAIWPSRVGHVRKPDVSFVRKSKLPGGIPGEGWLTAVPDIVAEIVSPGDDAEGLEEKLIEYREAGVSLIWIIFPRTQTAQVIRPGHVREELSANDVLDGRDILPGFSVRLADLLPQPEK